jgi:Xaa-Pro aminopeptidase
MNHAIKKKILILLLLITGLNIFSRAVLGQQAAFDKAEFQARRAKFVERIGAESVAVIFGANSHVYPVKFRQSPDFYYLTGIEEPGSVLIVNGARKASYVFVPKRSAGKVAAEGAGVRDLEKPTDFYGINVMPIENFYTYLGFATWGANKMYLPLTPPDDLQTARFEAAGVNAEMMENTVFRKEPEFMRLVAEVRKWKPNLPVADVNPILDELRWVKTPYEIERMRKSGQIAAEAMREAMKGTKPGMFEYEIEAAARFIQTKRGARGDAFTPIVASGPNTIIYHYTKNNRQMQGGEIVYLDYGADYDYYTSDITRTWAVSGRFTEEQEKWYRCILEARNAIIAAMKPGVSVKDLQKAAEPAYQKYGYLQEFINHRHGRGKPDRRRSGRGRRNIRSRRSEALRSKIKPLFPDFPDVFMLARQ